MGRGTEIKGAEVEHGITHVGHDDGVVVPCQAEHRERSRVDAAAEDQKGDDIEGDGSAGKGIRDRLREFRRRGRDETRIGRACEASRRSSGPRGTTRRRGVGVGSRIHTDRIGGGGFCGDGVLMDPMVWYLKSEVTKPTTPSTPKATKIKNKEPEIVDTEQE